MPKFRVRVLADATVYKEVDVEADKPVDALAKALSASELDGRPWLLSDGFQADQPYIGDPDNDCEVVDEVAPVDKPGEFPPCPWPVPKGYRLAKVGDVRAPGYALCSVDTGWSLGLINVGERVDAIMAERPTLWVANPVGRTTLTPDEFYGLVKLERGPALPNPTRSKEKAKAGKTRPRPRKSVKKRT